MSEHTSQVPNGFFSALRTGVFLAGKIYSAFNGARNGKENDIPLSMGPLAFQKTGNSYSITNNSDKRVLVFFSSTDNMGQARTGSILLKAGETKNDEDNLINNNIAGKISYSLLEDNKPMQFSISDWSNENPFIVLENTFTVNFISDETPPKIRIAADRDFKDIMITLVTQNKDSYTFGPVNIEHKKVSRDIECPSDMNQSIPFNNFIVSFTPTNSGIEKLVENHES
ncbi:hypothetical protein CVS42_01630 [Aeromonas veronii]|uniref:hypothetical protein n=1 Tax=Aeromonas veronii TaxID=654 RepID=UPI000C2876DA|nr:hypothetical protein [Aeromonas veronii]ATY79662.1 hypothetical protein CVS42_01630 [Aeromonas veronii]